MMVGERHRPNPTVQIPPWTSLEEDLTVDSSPCNDYSSLYLQEAIKALQRYLPSASSDDLLTGDDHDSPVDAYSCDQFRMYEFKVRRCARGRSHDWTDCPFAHPGEKARRRDPRRYHYSGAACPEFRKGSCKKGDACEYAHGVFECWLHPARYRTQPCKDGVNCRRRVCFFAHTPDQLRVLPGNPTLSSTSPPGSPPLSESPPMSPVLSQSLSDVINSLATMKMGQVSPYSSPSRWGVVSPRGSVLNPGYLSLPTTPNHLSWDRGSLGEETMERVESGRDIRKRMLEKLCKENSLEKTDPFFCGGGRFGPDVGWVSELLQ